MKPLLNETANKNGILRLRHRYGWFYGLSAGITFSLASWGQDALLLSLSHAYFPWIMLLVGLLVCSAFGGLAGGLTARSGSSLLSVLFWLGVALVFAWLMVALPLQIQPALAARLDPHLASLLPQGGINGFPLRFGTSLLWILPFMLITGVLQLPISEPAVFSASFFGKFIPLLLPALLLGMSGAFTDNLINAHFRDALNALDITIQFVVDNQGNEKPDPALSRQLHARALSEVNNLVQQDRRLFVRSHDDEFGEFHVLVKFGASWVDCLVLYNQPISCHAVD